jgi:hypothetical protein
VIEPIPCGQLCVETPPLVRGASPSFSIKISYSTIADNHGPSTIVGPFVQLLGSVVSNSVANCADGLVESLGHNIDSDGSCGLTDPTDLSGVDPMLGPLQNNGGPTPTHALLAESPARDAIPVASCTYDDDGDPATSEVPLTTDQRSVRRPQNGRCDIGAFERGCGLGAEVAILLPLLGAVRRRSARSNQPGTAPRYLRTCRN